jgi:hypothetical protein
MGSAAFHYRASPPLGPARLQVWAILPPRALLPATNCNPRLRSPAAPQCPQSCYGVPELPDQGDMWLCRACELKEEGKAAPQCCLCPVAGGALKPTTIPGLWCHAACLQWIPEVGGCDVGGVGS